MAKKESQKGKPLIATYFCIHCGQQFRYLNAMMAHEPLCKSSMKGGKKL